MAVAIVVCALLLAAQVIFMVLPASLIMLFTYALRPFAYAAALAAVWVFYGVDKPPIPQKRHSLMLSGLGVGIYVACFMAAGLTAGFGYNRLTSDFSAFFHQVWIYGVVAVMAEILRHRLIKGVATAWRGIVAVMLTLTFTVAQIDALRGFIIAGGAGTLDFLFSALLPALMLNAVLTYVAFSGVLTAHLLLRATYSLTPIFMPILPRLNGVAWAVIECAALFVTVLIYHAYTPRQRGETARKISRQGKYQKKPLALRVVVMTLAALMIAFNLRAFDYFPVVVSSGSMAGEIDMGAVVVVEKLPPDEVVSSVKQGDVIHFRQGDIEIIHRVSAFDTNRAGERVYITKGDANESADASPVEQGQVLGVCRASVGYLGYPSIWFRTFFESGGQK